MRIKDLTLCAVFSAIFALCSWIHIPGPVPFTMQTFGIYLALFLLEGKKATISIAVYLLLGIIGLPVFSGLQGGISAVLGATGGYLIGFLAISLIYWILSIKGVGGILSAAIGTIVCYITGTLWYALIYLGGSFESIIAALMQCVVPYILPDAVKLSLAYLVSRRIKKSTDF